MILLCNFKEMFLVAFKNIFSDDRLIASFKIDKIKTIKQEIKNTSKFFSIIPLSIAVLFIRGISKLIPVEINKNTADVTKNKIFLFSMLLLIFKF